MGSFAHVAMSMFHVHVRCMEVFVHGAMSMLHVQCHMHVHVLKMLRQVLNMLAIGTAFLDTLHRRPWNHPPDLRPLEGDPGGSCDFR